VRSSQTVPDEITIAVRDSLRIDREKRLHKEPTSMDTCVMAAERNWRNGTFQTRLMNTVTADATRALWCTQCEESLRADLGPIFDRLSDALPATCTTPGEVRSWLMRVLEVGGVSDEVPLSADLKAALSSAVKASNELALRDLGATVKAVFDDAEAAVRVGLQRYLRVEGGDALAVKQARPLPEPVQRIFSRGRKVCVWHAGPWGGGGCWLRDCRIVSRLCSRRLDHDPCVLLCNVTCPRKRVSPMWTGKQAAHQGELGEQVLLG
jgi:hypothetical protein